MNTTPEERAELRERHHAERRRWKVSIDSDDVCWPCVRNESCPTLRLLDDADEADALRARAEAAEVDNAALRDALRKSAIRYESAASLWVTCSLCSRSWDTPGEHHEGCILAQPHPGDALRERLRMAEERLQRVINAGHNDDCLFCAIKDTAAGLVWDAAREAGQ